MEITKYNIGDHLDEIIANIKLSVFIALDAEFTGLKINEIYKNSLFDSATQRYTKIRKGTDGIVATQIGLSLFNFNRDENAYKCATYNFLLCPQSIGSINQCFTFEAAALQFLCNHKFDYNKIIYDGIPYMNQIEEETLKNDLENDSLQAYMSNEDLEDMFNQEIKINEWLASSEKLTFYKISGSLCYCYILTNKLKKEFPDLNVINNGYEVILSRDSIPEKATQISDKDKLLELARGFSSVVKELIKARKPLVLHNALTDLIIFSNQFIEPLPSRYESFKNDIHEIFPVIYDTKYISNDMKFLVKKELFSESTNLEKLYDFFKDKGRNLAFYSPLVKMSDGFDPTPHFHQAGWDSFCTGYCFIRLCHWAASNKFGTEKTFTSTEHLVSMDNFANKVYLSRASQPHICIDRDDPPKHIPEYLYVETLGRESINVSEVTNSLSQFGSIDVKQYGKTCALVAVTNTMCAKKILYEFKKSPSWNISRYNVLKHSFIARLALWSGVVVSSGSLLALILQRI